MTGGIEQVEISSGTELVASHPRDWGAEHTTYDPRHYLALLERKPGAFDFARPLEQWDLPLCFRLLRRRLEADLGSKGTREFIKVLRLMERATLHQLTGAVEVALRIGATSADAVALILYHRCRAAGRPVQPRRAPAPEVRPARPARPHQLRGADRDRSMTMKTLETKSLVLLRHHLKALRLPTIGAEAEKVAVQAAADNQDHLSYLLQLCELELLEREKRAAERRLKAARFPTTKTLESFDFTARPSVNKRLVAELARCEYIDQRENVLLVGNPGTGKSHLATALAAEACARGYKVRFYRATELVTTLIEARDERSFLRLKTQLAKLDLLVLDELGYVPASKVGAELLFDVISTAYERTSMIVTTNLPFESWTEVLGSERLTGATLDRLTHRCRIIETKGESYRLHDAKSPQPTEEPTPTPAPTGHIASDQADG